MVWAGAPFAQLIEFSTGLPAGAVSYELFGNDGSSLLANSFAPEAGAVSHLLVIDGAHNGCATDLFENRTLVWTYTTATALVSERVTYRVMKPIPFSVSCEGVRAKLGVEQKELPDENVDLPLAYSEFSSFFAAGALDAYESSGDRTALLITHAIEAVAGLAVIPSLQLSVAVRETGGTNEYQRYGSVDWARIELELIGMIEKARAAVDPTYDSSGENVETFGLLSRGTDAFTGE